MLKSFNDFQIKNPKVICGGNGSNRDHGDDDGIPPDDAWRSTFNIGILMDHGDNGGIPPDNSKN